MTHDSVEVDIVQSVFTHSGDHVFILQRRDGSEYRAVNPLLKPSRSVICTSSRWINYQQRIGLKKQTTLKLMV